MQFKSSLLVALATAAVSAQGIVPTDAIGSSVILVLATAIPPESISLALNNPAQFSAELASSLSAGQIPEWYQALPSDVQSYLPQLYPASTAAETTAAETSTPAPTSTPVETGVSSFVSGSSSVAVNSTTILSVTSPTLSATDASSTGSVLSTGGAARPTAVVGAGLAGALGFLGLLAL